MKGGHHRLQNEGGDEANDKRLVGGPAMPCRDDLQFSAGGLSAIDNVQSTMILSSNRRRTPSAILTRVAEVALPM